MYIYRERERYVYTHIHYNIYIYIYIYMCTRIVYKFVHVLGGGGHHAHLISLDNY